MVDGHLDECASSVVGALVSFYLGLGGDSQGHTIWQIQSWDYDKLEHSHTYIQWLFPLIEPSNFNPHAPVLDTAQIMAFRSSERLRRTVVQSFEVMLNFYGFALEQAAGGVTITRATHWELRKRAWVKPFNHNFLRITRIITSLRLLGLDDFAQAFFAMLRNVFENEARTVIGERSFQYWQRSVVDPLPVDL
ncbi:MAG: hypothetical protein NVS2B7_33980 [Herpetosiphon sp.]